MTEEIVAPVRKPIVIKVCGTCGGTIDGYKYCKPCRAQMKGRSTKAEREASKIRSLEFRDKQKVKAKEAQEKALHEAGVPDLMDEISQPDLALLSQDQQRLQYAYSACLGLKIPFLVPDETVEQRDDRIYQAMLLAGEIARLDDIDERASMSSRLEQKWADRGVIGTTDENGVVWPNWIKAEVAERSGTYVEQLRPDDGTVPKTILSPAFQKQITEVQKDMERNNVKWR